MVRIQVFMNADAAKSGSSVLGRLFSWDDSLIFPAHETIKVMKAIYGKSAVVRFEIE